MVQILLDRGVKKVVGADVDIARVETANALGSRVEVLAVMALEVVEVVEVMVVVVAILLRVEFESHIRRGRITSTHFRLVWCAVETTRTASCSR